MTIWAILAVALISIAGDSFGYALSLAGVAGLVISLGVTADSYIVFFERLKDEVRAGRSPRAAVQPAFERAFHTIVAADIVTGIAAAVLYLTAVSSVRGFALTLGVATAARPVRRLVLQAPDGVPDRARTRARGDARASGSTRRRPPTTSARVTRERRRDLPRALDDYRGYRDPARSADRAPEPVVHLLRGPDRAVSIVGICCSAA